MHQYFGLIYDNPIFLRELRRRMRGKALVYGMIAYILIMSGLTYIILLSKTPIITMAGKKETLTRLAETGQALLTAVSIVQFFLVVILAPVLTAGVVTEEREKQTFDFLKVTTLQPLAYIIGCLLSTLMYVMLALSCAIPLISLAFLYGGVAPADIASKLGVFLALALLLSSAGLYISSICSRTRNAQTLILFTIIGLMIAGSVANGSAFFSNVGLADGGLVTFWGKAVPQYVYIGALTLWTSLFFLVAATRKIYNPTDSAFDYLSFTVFFLSGLWLTLGALIKTFFEPQFIFASTALLIIAVFSFGIRQFEMGEIIWRVKKRIRILRPINEGIIYIAVLLGIVAWLLGYWERTASTKPDPAGEIWAMWLSMAAMIMFLCYLGWILPASGLNRRQTRITLFIVAALLITAGPLLYAIWNLKTDVMGPFAALILCTPMGVNLARLENFYSANELLSLTQIYCGSFYGVLAVIALIYYLKNRHRRFAIAGFYEVDESELPPPAPFVIPVGGQHRD